MGPPTAIDGPDAVRWFRLGGGCFEEITRHIARKVERDAYGCHTATVARLLAMALAYWEEHR